MIVSPVNLDPAICPPLPAADLVEVLAATRGLWDEARGCSFLITGGTGFFGRWLLESFAHANETLGLGARAVVLTRDPAAFARQAPHLAGRRGLEFVCGDVRDFAFPAGEFPFVIHAATAASARLNEEAPLEMFETIVGGTRRVLEFAAQAGTRKFLLTSSGAVYGRQPPELIHVPEDYVGAPDPLLPASAYGEGKRAAEHLGVLHARAQGFEVKIARGFAFVGPHLPLDAHFAVGNFIRDALAGGPIRVGGDGTPHRSYLYAADLAVWLWTILFRGASGRAYNVGSGEDHSIAQVAAVVGAVLGGLEVRVAQMADPGRPPARYVPDVGRAARELGLCATVPLAEAVRRTARWHTG
jgi:dTDP-glucose 4,6-dehydratase